MRPKGWVNQRNRYLEQNQPPPPYYKTRQKDYEAGADAYEKALQARGREKTKGASYEGAHIQANVKGNLVFIPDEESILARQAIEDDVAEQIEDLQIDNRR